MAQQLGQVAVGTLVKLNENGSPVEVIVGRQNYESELNGNGRTLLIRIGSNYTMQWGPSSMSDPLYAASTVDTWLNTAYKAMLDAPIQEAIATTKFYYTPSGGASRSILERAVFLGSATEFGFSNSPNGYVTFNTEGSPLPENIVDKIQYPPESWTRTPTAQFRVAISTHGSAWVPVLGAKAPDFITHVDPFFTLPSTFYVNDDGEISPIPLAPGSIDVPVQVMVGKPISISWSAVDGAASCFWRETRIAEDGLKFIREPIPAIRIRLENGRMRSIASEPMQTGFIVITLLAKQYLLPRCLRW